MPDVYCSHRGPWYSSVTECDGKVSDCNFVSTSPLMDQQILSSAEVEQARLGQDLGEWQQQER